MKNKVLAIIMILALLVCSCGRQVSEESVADPKAEETETEEIRWKLQETKLPDANESLANILPEGAKKLSEYLYGMMGDTIYRIVRINGEEAGMTCIQKLEPPYTEWENTAIPDEEWVEGKLCYPRVASLCANSVQMLLTDSGEAGEEGWYKAEWTPETGCKAEVISSEYFTDEFWQDVRTAYVASDEVSYFAKTEGVLYFDKTFQEKKEWLDTGYVWQLMEDVSEDGKVYFCGSSISGGFRIWTAESKEPVFSADDVMMNFDGKVAFSSTSEGYLCVPEGIWQFHMDGGELESLMNFQEQGYSVERVYGAFVKEDGNLLISAVVDGEYLLLERMVDEDWKNKKELELVTLWADPFLKQAVTDFNRQSDEYYMILKEKGEEEDWIDFKTRIQVEIGSGKGPAIVSNSVVDLHAAAGKGLLRNLTEDFTEEKDRVPENVWSSVEENGECFAIPYGFSIETLVVSADIVGEREYWTTEEFVKYVKSSGAEAAVSRMDGSNLFWVLIRQGKLIDWENGKSYLNTGEAVELLEFAGEYGAEDTYEDAGIRVADGRTLATWASISGIDNVLGCVYEAMFQGKEVYIGYPVDDFPKENGNRLSSNALAVNQACEYPEGAIAFIRYLLTQEKQMELAKKNASEGFMYDFPVDSEALEYAFRYAGELYENAESLYAADSGFEFYTGPISEESMEKLWKLLQSARPQTAYTNGVETIVFEETSAYFSGDRTAQEVCDIIQNRVQLYLDEVQ